MYSIIKLYECKNVFSLRTHVYIFVHMHVHVHTYMYLHVYNYYGMALGPFLSHRFDVCTCTCTCIYNYIQCTCTCMYIHMYVFVYMYIFKEVVSFQRLGQLMCVVVVRNRTQYIPVRTSKR